MLYLLDTTSCSALMERHAQAEARLSALDRNDEVAMCAISRGELLYGLARLPHGKRRRQLEDEAEKLFARGSCVSVPAAAGDAYARTKRHTQRQGTTVDENDLWIAATSLALGAVLVTSDRDFARIEGLAIEDWTG